MAENAAISTVVYTATATDVDSGQTLSYSLTGTDAGSFDIDASTGVVTLKASANYESKASYSFNVVVTDNGTGSLTDTKAVTVNVTNVNEAPTITSVSTGTVAENAAISTVVYTATATDVDAGQTLSYSLTGTDAGSFDIDASTGVVTLKASANYESKASYSFNVVATDNGTGSLTDTKAVTVTVTNVNEAPTITSGASGTVAENAATSTVVYTATATDVDAGQTLSYSLTGTDAGSFDIDASSGVVTLKASANYEAKASYSFNVVATDNVIGSLTDTKAVTVTVTDVNEAPSITSGTSGTVAENAATSTVIYTATATDVDAGQTLSYSLTGTDAGSFDIDASTGEVTLKASANYEAKASYSFNVVATDNGTGTLTDTKAVTVTVTDVNEEPTGSLSITGTVKQGETLSVLDTLADDDGMTDKAYQWFANGQLITGANQSTLTLGQDQVGKVITVKASYTDRNGRVEVSSSGTVAVVNTNDLTTGEVSVRGDADVGQTLTASNNLSDADGMGDVQYQWQFKDANGVWREITLADGSLATGSQYTVSPAYALAELRVEARFTDGQGTEEVRHSTANIKAGGLPPKPVLPAPVINSITVAQPTPVVDVIPPPVASFMSVNTINSISVLASGASLLNSPAPLVLESPAQSPSSSVVMLGVSNPSSSSTSGLRAVEASRDVVIERGVQTSFSLPAGTFVHTDGAARVTLTARLADGRPLPANVKFNPTTGTFTVEAAPGEQAEQLQVVVNAVDDKGQTASTTLVIKLKEKASNSSALDLPIKLGKLSLGEQIRMADKSAGQMAELAALSKAFAASQHARSHT